VNAGALGLDRERCSRCARSRFGSRRNGRPSRSWISGPHQAASCRSEAIACLRRVGATVAEARSIATYIGGSQSARAPFDWWDAAAGAIARFPLKGNGGIVNGSAASCISSSKLSSPAIRLSRRRPQSVQRWMRTHRPSPRTVTAIGSIPAEQLALRSPGALRSRCLDQRQAGQ
jgi:hypothetical protein